MTKIIDYNKVVRGLERHLDGTNDCAGCPYLDERPCTQTLLKDALALIREQQEQLKSRGWISVKDRLPPKHEDVLVYVDRKLNKYYSNEYINLTWINTDNGDWDAGGFQQDDDREFITHWMPLPEKPEKEA